MQSFFNNKDEEQGLIGLTNAVFETLLKYFDFKSYSVSPRIGKSLWDTVHRLVKIASEQNKLLLQFPAVLAYFVYNFLKNFDLDELEHINEKLDNIQRLIERKNLQGLSFNTIKQMLQQDYRRKNPGKVEMKDSKNKS